MAAQASLIHDMHTHAPRKDEGAGPRVLFVSTVAVTLRSFLLPIARHFQDKGWRVDALANGAVEDAVCRSTFDRIWDAEWGRNAAHPRNFKMLSRLRELVVEQGYDIM